VCSHGATTAWRERLARRRLIEDNWRELSTIGDEARAFTRFGADTLHADTSRYGHRGRHRNVVFCMLVWWDLGLVMSANDDFTIRVRGIGSGGHQRWLVGHGGQVLKLAGAEDQDLLVSGGGDSTVRLWKPSAGTCLGVVAYTTWSFSLAVLPAKVVVVGCGKWGARVVKVFDGDLVGRWQEGLELRGVVSTSTVRVLVSDGKRIFTGDDDGDIRVFELESGTCTGVLFRVPKVSSLLLRGNTLVAGCYNGEIRVWDDFRSDDHTPREFKEQEPVAEGVTSMSWQDGVGPLRVVSNHWDGFRLWDFETGCCIMFLATIIEIANGGHLDHPSVHGCAADFHRLVYAQGGDIKVIDVQMPNPDGYDDSKQGQESNK
jgi:WD40 repeat protein